MHDSVTQTLIDCNRMLMSFANLQESMHALLQESWFLWHQGFAAGSGALGTCAWPTASRQLYLTLDLLEAKSVSLSGRAAKAEQLHLASRHLARCDRLLDISKPECWKMVHDLNLGIIPRQILQPTGLACWQHDVLYLLVKYCRVDSSCDVLRC